MNYETAKALQEAGFPQPDKEDEWTVPNGKGQQFYMPTLDELVAACGEDFDALHSPYDMQQEGYPEIKQWEADSTNRRGLRAKGLTPSIAVARLFISLQEKK